LESILGFATEENESNIRALIELIATGESIALVGAGVSIAAKYDSWPKLLEKLELRAKEIRDGLRLTRRTGEPREYLAIAQQLREHISPPPASRESWHTEIGRLFSRQPETVLGDLTSLHRDLVNLPFRAFLTTNFEEVIETALTNFHPATPRVEGVAIWNSPNSRLVSHALRGIAEPTDGTKYVLHLHGVYSSGPSVILCADDYASAYGIPELVSLGPTLPSGEAIAPLPATPPTKLFLLTTALLATRRVVFIGFSLDDVYFSEILRRVSDMLWEWDTTPHFAIMPIDPDKAAEQLGRAAELKRKSGIETVFFPVFDNDYRGLEKLISRIATEVEARRRDSRSPPSSVPPTPPAAAPSTMPAWVGRNNAEQLARFEIHED
jgi:hypothetical protein